MKEQMLIRAENLFAEVVGRRKETNEGGEVPWALENGEGLTSQAWKAWEKLL